ncbi:MAG: M56 family metallopeptidase [Acidobacteriota bacterium]
MSFFWSDIDASRLHIDAWSRAMLDVSWQTTLLVVLLLGLARLTRGWPAQARYVMWLLVMVRLMVPVGLESPWGLVREPAQLDIPVIHIAGPMPDDVVVEVEASDSHEVVAPVVAKIHLANLLFAFWMAGVGALAFAHAARSYVARRRIDALPRAPIRVIDLVARLEAELGVSRPVEVRTTGDARIAAPAVFGCRRSVIVLPIDMATSWHEDELGPVLVHELLHIRRGDLLIHQLQIWLQILYFFHPLVWLANRHISRERELACDDAVLAHYAGRPEPYVRSLLKVVTRYRHRSSTALAMARASGMGRRLRRLAQGTPASLATRRPRLTITGLVLVAILAASSTAWRVDIIEATESTSPTHDDVLRLLQREDPPEQVLDWITTHPWSALTADMASVLIVARDEALVTEAIALWHEQLSRHPHDAVLHGRAGAFIGHFDLEEGMALLRQAAEMDPSRATWPSRLANFYLRDGRFDEAFVAQRDAFELTRDDWLRLRAESRLAELAVAAGELDTAAFHAHAVFADLDRFDRVFVNDLIHVSHQVLGRVALRGGDIDRALDHLAKSTEVDISPTLGSFGPRLALADELLALGEDAAVLDYFAASRSFWKTGRDDLDLWMAEIRRGKVPDLSRRVNGC